MMRYLKATPIAVLTAATISLAIIPVASADNAPSAQASCVGTLSSFAGQNGIRQNYAPRPGTNVANIAQAHLGDLGDCFALVQLPPNP
jgi:hypothetical protein